MLDWLNFRLGKIIGLIQHAVEKRYYQNKTQLRYNFGSVYIIINSTFVILMVKWNKNEIIMIKKKTKKKQKKNGSNRYA